MKPYRRSMLILAGAFLLFCSCVVLLNYPRILGARWAACMTDSVKDLRSIGLAVHNYHDVHRQLPFGTLTVDGRGYHSWLTALLPFIESSDLYSRIDFDRPWTDPINRAVFQTIYPSYINPCEPSPRPVDGYAVSHYAGNSLVLRPNEQTGMSDIRDGTSNTILAGQVSGGLKAWGDPTNTRDPRDGVGKSAHQFGRTKPSGVYFLMMDGRVRQFSPNVDLTLLKALSTPSGGELVPDDF